MIINLGDTLIHKNEWKIIKSSDILMIPIGGRKAHNTMDEDEALETVEMLKPRLMIPCYYNAPAFHKKNANPTNEKYFNEKGRKMNFDCVLLKINESTEM